MPVGAALLWASASCLHGRDSAPVAGGAAGLHWSGGASGGDGRSHEQGSASAQTGAPHLPAAPAPQVSRLRKNKTCHQLKLVTNLFVTLCTGHQIQIIYTFLSVCFASFRFRIDCTSIHFTFDLIGKPYGSRKDEKINKDRRQMGSTHNLKVANRFELVNSTIRSHPV